MPSLQDFKPEPGYPGCGTSYTKALVVSGKLPNGFGAENTHELPAMTPPLSGNWWGRGTAEEADMVADIHDAIARFKDAYNSAMALRLEAKERVALWSLVLKAEQNLRRVSEIYDWWAGKIPGLPHDFQVGGRTSEWPLTESDIQSEYMGACSADRKGQWVEDRQLGLGGMRVVRLYYCANDALLERRSQERWLIFDLIRSAARLVRCASWTLWRVSLYRKSLAEFDEVDAGDFVPKPPKAPPKTPFTGPGGYLPADWEPPPQPTPPKPKTTFPTSPADAFIPRPPVVEPPGPKIPIPPWEPPPSPGGGGPEGGTGPGGGGGAGPDGVPEPQPPPPHGGTQAPASSGWSVAVPIAAGVAALGLFWVMR